MKTIPLTQGKYAIVDDVDFEWLSQWKWCANKDRNTWYAVRTMHKDEKQIKIMMHREILGLKHGDGMDTDHKDGDGLNNRRENLRTATHAQNMYNQRIRKGTSQFKSVHWNRCAAKWCAQIRVNNRLIYLGYFVSEIEAGLAYDMAAQKYFGEFAKLNVA